MFYNIPYFEQIPSFPFPNKNLYFNGFNRNDTIHKTEPNVKLMEKINEERIRILESNSKLFFPENFLQEYENNGLEFRDIRVLGPITRLHGFDLENPYHKLSPLEVLQIGCGPDKVAPDMYNKGPQIDKILRNLGANVTNFDIVDVGEHYKESEFVQGDWKDIDSPSLFGERQFDVIFTDEMFPEPVNYFKLGNENFFAGEQSLLLKTLSRVKPYGGMFIIGIRDCTSFHFSDYVHQLTSKIDPRFDQTYIITPNESQGHIQLYHRHN